MDAGVKRLPPWLVNPNGGLGAGDATKRLLRRGRLVTVCEEARCPNLGECFSRRTATFMLGGDTCTRKCSFCSVATGRPSPDDPLEGERVARAAKDLGLRYVVLTTVARDDLPDEGADGFVRAIEALRRLVEGVQVEVLTADFNGREDLISRVLDAHPEVFGHNMETVRRLTPECRGRARYDRSLEVLRFAAMSSGVAVPRASESRASESGASESGATESGATEPGDAAWGSIGSVGAARLARGAGAVKTGVMVGMGESRAELSETLRDIRDTGCELITVGQYLRPTREHRPVDRFVEPSEFDEIAAEARELGFVEVASGPLVRSSYRADALYASAGVLES